MTKKNKDITPDKSLIQKLGLTVYRTKGCLTSGPCHQKKHPMPHQMPDSFQIGISPESDAVLFISDAITA